jgi:hypothetical protein
MVVEQAFGAGRLFFLVQSPHSLFDAPAGNRIGALEGGWRDGDPDRRNRTTAIPLGFYLTESVREKSFPFHVSSLAFLFACRGLPKGYPCTR